MQPDHLHSLTETALRQKIINKSSAFQLLETTCIRFIPNQFL